MKNLLPTEKRVVDRTPLNRCFWLLLPAVIVYPLCLVYLRAFPLWSFIVEGLSIVAFLVAITIVCIRLKIYLTLVKLYFSVISLGASLYLMSQVSKWL